MGFEPPTDQSEERRRPNRADSNSRLLGKTHLAMDEERESLAERRRGYRESRKLS